MRIILDFDNTIVQTDRAMFDFYREVTKDYSTTYSQDKATWNMLALCPKFSPQEMDDMFIQEGFFKHLKLYDNAIEVINRLKKQSHYLEIASCHRVEGAEFKKKWIKKYLPMIDKVTIIPIEHGMQKFDKSEIKGDLILDDSLSALKSSVCKYKVAYGTYDWNKSWSGERVNNWLEFEKLVDRYK